MSRPGNQDRITNRRRVAFRFLAIVLSLIPIALVEIGLRLFGDAIHEAVDETPVVNLEGLRPLFVLDHLLGQPSRWRIPDSRMNFFRPDSFLAEKPRHGKRVFVLGGSTVQGRPYATETAFSTWLRLRLEATSPDTPIEVVNCGGVSYASYRVSKILDEVLAHDADAIVLYTGHNEFLESRSYADIRDLSEGRRWVTMLASKFAIVRTLRRWFSLETAPVNVTSLSKLPTEVDARLDHAGGLNEYRRDDRWRASVERHFDSTLRSMAMACENAGVPLIVCVPACDWVNTPPFKMELAPSLAAIERQQFSDRWNVATGSDEAVTRDERVAAAKQCLAIDPHHAGANYLLGRWEYDDGDAARAFVYFQNAVDNDVCPLRATTPIVESIRALIDEFNLRHVDVVALLDQRSASGLSIPDSISDLERFVDHVHPTIGGHQAIADAIAVELERIGWPRADDAAIQRYSRASREHLDSLSEAYYGRGKQRLAGLRNWAAGRAASIGMIEQSHAGASDTSSYSSHQPSQDHAD